MLFIKLLILIWLINFAPPFLANIFELGGGRTVDNGYLFFDGRPLFGKHKTVRGLLAGIISGGTIGLVLGFPPWFGLSIACLSMSGDLLSSFCKRRLSFFNGDTVPILDQVPEGLLPFALIGPYYSLSVGYVLLFGIVFGLGAYYGSVFLNQVLLEKPSKFYPRRVRALTRFRELVSCRITAKPFRYILNFEDAVYYHLFMKSVFKAIHIYERGKRNALVIEKREVSFHFPDLPPAFDGYKLLFLADPHLDCIDGLTEKIIEIVRQDSGGLVHSGRRLPDENLRSVCCRP